MQGSTPYAHEGEHTIPFGVYVKVLVTLLVLTVLTVGASEINFGVFNIIIAMIIASIKAGVVGLFFMHLKYENKLIWLYVAIPLVLLAIMLAGIFTDNPFRSEPSPTSPAKVTAQQ